MSHTIQITDEQLAALNRGESITIKPSVKKWEPPGGNFYITPLGDINKSSSSSIYASIIGHEYLTEEHAERDARELRMRNRLRAFRDQYWPEWVADWDDLEQNKCSLFVKNGKWEYSPTWSSKRPGVVYGPLEFAERAVKMLNSGEMEL